MVSCWAHLAHRELPTFSQGDLNLMEDFPLNPKIYQHAGWSSAWQATVWNEAMIILFSSKPLAISTVKIGAEDFTVSVKETATYFRATKPNRTVVKLQQNNIQWEKVYYLQHVSFHSNTWSLYSTSWTWHLLELGMMRGAHSHSGRSAWLGLNPRPRNINPPALWP